MKKLLATICAGAVLGLMASCDDAPGKAKAYNQGINIIPTPVSLTQNEGNFKLNKNTKIYASTPEAKTVAEFFAAKMNTATGYQIATADKETSDGISLVIDGSLDVNDEGYTLDVADSGVRIKAKTPQGLFYGMQSFLQLLPAEIESPSAVQGIAWTAPAVSIKDEPRFGYRGIMLDPCRHFIPVENIKKQLDVLALFKINRMHWHLTDDQGWRIEIKKYPKLTEIGSKRIDGEGTEYGGFYTQEEVKEIVRYAADRFITIVPEIELPGHEMAAIAAYPELSCEGKQGTPRIIWGVEDIVLCAGKEEPFQFFEDVIAEVAPLFPGEYFHIGGDEARKVAWATCPKCQALIERERLDGIQGLQPYMIARIQDFLASKGRVMVGWDEILHNELHSETLVMSYRGQKGAIEAANRGNYAVMTPGEVLYFDWYQADPSTQPRAMYGYSPIKKMYAFEPVPADPESAARNESIIRAEFVDPAAVEPIRADRADRIVGVQGCTWAEYIEDEEQQEYMIFPRLLAVAELAWTPQEKREWSDFKVRMNSHIPLLQQRGLNTFTLSDEVEITTRIRSGNKAVEVTLDCEKYPAEIRYTLDGTPPTPDASLYEAPFTVTDSTVVRAAVCRDGVIRSPERKQLVTLAAEIDNYYPFDVPEIWKEYFD
mgnify:CR=1 FL=1